MHKYFAIATSILFLLFNLGCDQLLEDADDVADPTGGRCYLSNSGNNQFCIYYAAGDPNTGSAECSQERTDRGWSGESWLTGTGNQCDGSNVVGTCDIGNSRTVYYYGPDFDSSSANSDCTSSFGGTFAAP